MLLCPLSVNQDLIAIKAIYTSAKIHVKRERDTI